MFKAKADKLTMSHQIENVNQEIEIIKKEPNGNSGVKN